MKLSNLPRWIMGALFGGGIFIAAKSLNDGTKDDDALGKAAVRLAEYQVETAEAEQRLQQVEAPKEITREFFIKDLEITISKYESALKLGQYGKLSPTEYWVYNSRINLLYEIYEFVKDNPQIKPSSYNMMLASLDSFDVYAKETANARYLVERAAIETAEGLQQLGNPKRSR